MQENYCGKDAQLDLDPKTIGMTERESLNSMEAEQSVIGALLLDASCIDKIAGLLSEADFFAHDHRAIFRAITRLVDKSKSVDVITIAEFLQEHNMLDQVGGVPALGSFTANVPSTANIVHYASIVHNYALLRRIKSAADEVAELVFRRDGKEAREIVDFAQAKMMGLSDALNGDANAPKRIDDVMQDVSRRIDELYEMKSDSGVTGLSTGFHKLDNMTTGFHPGDLIILAGRPSMGKTAYSLNIVEHVGLVLRKPVLVFSLEMISQQLGLRMMSSLSQIHAQRVRTGRIYDGEWSRVTEALSSVQDAPIWIDEESNITSAEIRARARRIHRECGGLSLILIDYLQLMSSETSSSSVNRSTELADITRGLKLLAKELRCPVIVLSQLNRSLESRPNKRPVMSDLRDSGAIEQDADIVIFLYRDEVYNPESLDAGLAEIIIGKQRNGPIGKVIVKFKGELTRFEDTEPYERLPSAEARANKRAARGSFPRKNENDGGDQS